MYDKRYIIALDPTATNLEESYSPINSLYVVVVIPMSHFYHPRHRIYLRSAVASICIVDAMQPDQEKVITDYLNFINNSVISIRTNIKLLLLKNCGPISFTRHLTDSKITVLKEKYQFSKSLQLKADKITNISEFWQSIIDLVKNYEKNQSKGLLKIITVGDVGCGRTTLLHRLKTNQFTSPPATIGVDFFLQYSSKEIPLQIWDIAGQERFGNMHRVYYRDSSAAVLAFDVSRLSTLTAIDHWMKGFRERVLLPDGTSLPCMLLMTKGDLEHAVTFPQMLEKARKYKFLIIYETSAKENVNIRYFADIVQQLAQFKVEQYYNPEYIYAYRYSGKLELYSATDNKNQTPLQTKSIQDTINIQPETDLAKRELEPIAHAAAARKDVKIAITKNKFPKLETSLKVVTVGDPGCGRSTLINWIQTKEYNSTLCATLGVDSFTQPASDKTSIQLWDIAGQERFGDMTRVYYRQTHAACIAYDPTRRHTFNEVGKWKEDIDRKAQLPNGDPIPCMLIIPKYDLQKEVLFIEALQLARKLHFLVIFEYSTKEKINVDYFVDVAHHLTLFEHQGWYDCSYIYAYRGTGKLELYSTEETDEQPVATYSIKESLEWQFGVAGDG